MPDIERLTIATRTAQRVEPCSRNDYGYRTFYQSFVVDSQTGADIAGPFDTGDEAHAERERIWERRPL